MVSYITVQNPFNWNVVKQTHTFDMVTGVDYLIILNRTGHTPTLASTQYES